MRAETALRLHVGAAAGEADGDAPALLAAGAEFDLPGTAAAHVKVRRLQPGAALHLFDGHRGEEWPAEVLAITRAGVRVRVAGAPVPAAAAELPLAVSLAFGMPANERVDTLVEKATELGVAALWPLMSERSVLRLEGERAERRRAHWQAVAAAASEQCGRARVPRVHAVLPLQAWLRMQRQARHAEAGAGAAARRWLLSTWADAPALAAVGIASSAESSDGDAGPAASADPNAAVLVLSGPEGGFTPSETEAARADGFTAVSLGPRILRADTAPLAALAWLGIACAQRPEPKSGA